jgi:predicted PurR-regulated permease PerM
MWSSVWSRFGIDRILITVVSSLAFLSVAPPIVSVAAAKVSHSRERTTVPQRLPAVVREPTIREPTIDEELKQQSKILAGLQASQSALEKETIDSNAAIQRQMNQLNAELGDSRKGTQQMLEQVTQGINSTRRWLKTAILIFVLSLGGMLFYVIRQLPKPQDNTVKWKGKVPKLSPDEEDVIAWQSGEPVNAPARRSDVHLSSPPR